MENLPFSSPAVAVIIAKSCAYHREDDQVELTWVVGYAVRWCASLKAITHPITNRAQWTAT